MASEMATKAECDLHGGKETAFLNEKKKFF